MPGNGNKVFCIFLAFAFSTKFYQGWSLDSTFLIKSSLCHFIERSPGLLFGTLELFSLTLGLGGFFHPLFPIKIVSFLLSFRRNLKADLPPAALTKRTIESNKPNKGDILYCFCQEKK